MHIRQTTSIDIEAVNDIYRYAKANFKAQGIDQWQGKYPDAEVIAEDVAQGVGYVLEDGGRVIGAVAITQLPEESYRGIYDGAWLTEGERYVTVHRIAIAGARKGAGLSKLLMQEADRLARQVGCPSVRADTHPDNRVMQRLMEGLGYRRCGMIRLTRGDEAAGLRMCYEKIL
ncbi:MAG: GNAT family N-acetyltransferase [Clostridiales bacterium]|nr:GNAT family N-acetyltransferase [Clostridiales bacterium]